MRTKNDLGSVPVKRRMVRLNTSNGGFTEIRRGQEGSI
jgi:hypothetical protein